MLEAKKAEMEFNQAVEVAIMQDEFSLLVKRGVFIPTAVPTGKCKVCGCTDDDCRQCIESQGFPCSWVEDDLCSRCANQTKDE